MSKINDIVVLNTVSALGADASVDANGFLNVVGADSIKASRIQNMQIQPYVAEVARVEVITPTAANNATYKFAISGIDITNGLPYYKTFTYLSSGTATRLEIVNAFVSLVNADTKINVTASQTGSNPNETLTLTAKVGFARFSVIESDANLSVSVSTAGTIGVGLGSNIALKYPASSFPAIANIAAAGQYTTVTIEHEDVSAYGEASALPNQYKTLTVFVREGVTNVATLVGNYGTLTALKQGYRAVISAPETTTAAVTVTTGAIALSGGSVTLASLAAQSGDWIAIGAETTKITGITGAAAGFGTNVAAVSAATFLFSAWRNLPA
jgi:hypothetical protein